MNPGVPGMALGLYYLGGDPGQVCNAGGPLALDEVILREGSLLAPRFPAPLGMRGLTMMRVLAALMGLVSVAGGKGPAAHSAYVITLMRGSFTKEDGEKAPFLLADGIGVGYGARPYADGIDAVYFVAQENYPVEFLEIGYPVRLRAYGIVRDSGGPGAFAAAAASCANTRSSPTRRSSRCASTASQNPPWGIAGGMSGGSGRAVVNPGHAAGARAVAALATATRSSAATSCASRRAAAAAMGIPSTVQPEARARGRARRLRQRGGRCRRITASRSGTRPSTKRRPARSARSASPQAPFTAKSMSMSLA